MTRFTLLILLLPCLLSAQSTGMRVYQILQDNCIQCHSSGSPAAGLDLQGQGSSVEERAADVFQTIYNGTPANAAALAAGNALIYPGRPDKSFLFRKINRGLEPTLALSAQEGQAMPPAGHEPLTDVEKELLRQWILFGAPAEGEVVEETLLEEYYSGNAIQSFPDGPPPAPTPGEGFQVKMGPFYIEPGGEVEFFQKYELDLPADQDVTRLDMKIGTFSHHFIVYDFNAGGDSGIPHGLRLEADHSNIGLMAAVQEPTDLVLPEGTAFIWEEGLVLDLNSHYINYSATAVYQAEVYLNVYTQPVGTAAQEMKAQLISNFNIFIPNDGNPVTHSQVINYNFGELFVWGLMGHTHQWGTGYKIYQRNEDGSETLIYDGACPRGEPGCVSPFFDYHHIPMRYFDPLYPLEMRPWRGLRHEASWQNFGPEPVGFGPTSDDEMMVMIMMYTEDTTGVVMTSAADLPIQESPAQVFPNPASGQLSIAWEKANGPATLQLFDLQGREAFSCPLQAGHGTASVQLPALPAGLYLYRLRSQSGHQASGKIMLE